MIENNLQQSHEPELLRQLRQKTLNLKSRIEKLTNENKQKRMKKQKLDGQLKNILYETEVQQKKHRSLIVLLNQLQQTYNNEYVEQKQEKEKDQTVLNLENSILRFLLIKQTESIKQGQKLANFLKHVMLDKNKGKTKQFIKKSNFIQGQSELIAKLKSQIYLMKNQNLECKRKWYQLQQQSKNLQSHNKLLSIQNERQKTEIRTMYEQYLQKINEAKTKIVNYNDTQKQSIIHEYLVKEIAIIQQKRVEIQQQNSNLQFHFQNLKQQLERIQIENKELVGFFSESGQQGSLAQKMRKRIQQLRDVLIECKKKNKNTRAIKLRKVFENVKAVCNLLSQSNDYVQMKSKQQERYGSFLEQKPIADFFGKILQEKDQAIALMREEQASLNQKVKQLQIQKQLLLNQISSLEDNLSMGDWSTNFAQNKNWAQIPREVDRKNQIDKEKRPIEPNTRFDWKNSGNFTFEMRKN